MSPYEALARAQATMQRQRDVIERLTGARVGGDQWGGDPWVGDADMGTCFYCHVPQGFGSRETGHEEDCPYVRAMEEVNR